MDELTSTTGIVAIAGCAVALAALGVAVAAVVSLRRIRRDQRAVLGDYGEHDLVTHAAGLEREFRSLHAFMEDAAQRLHERMGSAEERLDGAISHSALVRYDAYGEMTGHQSTSIALLDAQRNGVVLSSIMHRDAGRLYAKQVRAGEGHVVALSPEEAEAVRLALEGDDEPAPDG
ncbi:DUF4446 family protein [Conexibacter arvalis]|uniref:DUF4446 family protein n=1 Tax=Conexibacter arvalis TaxID=912552 RepID=A0A840IAD5_9ACTN|nr:hypothetical protein [Conexibacter arvalis]